MASPEIVFSQNVQSMNEWAMRTGIPLASRADDMNVPYRRAHRWLRQIKDELCARHGFVEVPSSDPRIMYSIECPPLRSPNGLQRSPPFRLQIPLDVTTFFAPQRRVEWEMQFHSAAFGYMRRSNPAILDLFNLLQSRSCAPSARSPCRIGSRTMAPSLRTSSAWTGIVPSIVRRATSACRTSSSKSCTEGSGGCVCQRARMARAQYTREAWTTLPILNRGRCIAAGSLTYLDSFRLLILTSHK